jgi:tetratricopeptide (TPR) repeat protein
MPPLMPSNAQDYYNRGRDYHRQANYDRAISDYTQAIELKPNYTDA